MKLITLILHLSILGTLNAASKTLFSRTKFQFYTHTVTLTAIELRNIKFFKSIDDSKLQQIYAELNTVSDFNTLVLEIDSVVKITDLCSWLKFKLVEKYVLESFPAYQLNEKRIILCYILNKIGYDTRITFDKERNLLINVEKGLHGEIGILTAEGKEFFRLTKTSDNKFIYSKYIKVAKTNKIFTLSDLRPPILENCELEKKEISIKSSGKEIKVSYIINKTAIKIYDDYPGLDYYFFLNVELSQECRESLFPQICGKLLNDDTITSIRNILAFSQDVAGHKDDLEFFGKERPMTPEEALYYPFSDCEDKSVLFYYLTKKLYPINSLVLEYPNHVNVGLNIPIKGFKDILIYQGLKYVICEPSDVTGNTEIGWSPKFERYPNPKVRISYNPKLINTINYMCK